MLLSFFDLTNLAVAKSGLSCGSVWAPEMQSHLWAAGGARGVQAEPLLPSSQLEEFSLAGHAGRGISVAEAVVRVLFFAGSWCGTHLQGVRTSRVPAIWPTRPGRTFYAEFLTLGPHGRSN